MNFPSETVVLVVCYNRNTSAVIGYVEDTQLVARKNWFQFIVP